MKDYLLEIEGLDKCGKDILVNYINRLSNFRFIVHARGLLSNMVYSEKFNRNYDYELVYKPIIIFLDVDEEDRLIRCKITGESSIDANNDKALFEKHLKLLKEKGFRVLRYNTSKMTPYQIAEDIIKKLPS